MKEIRMPSGCTEMTVDEMESDGGWSWDKIFNNDYTYAVLTGAATGAILGAGAGSVMGTAVGAGALSGATIAATDQVIANGTGKGIKDHVSDLGR